MATRCGVTALMGYMVAFTVRDIIDVEPRR
jgi:hypothetical protein